ncbi:MAG: hypothetical protein HY097_10170 [Nitrospinae bacterium]|nr:hypothetical protein [Nitrospinota bacterium]
MATFRDGEDGKRDKLMKGRIKVKMKHEKNSRETLRLKLFFKKNISLLLYGINL